MRNILFYLLVITTICSCKQEDISREEVINVIRKFDNGWQHKNLASVDSVLSPSYIYFTQSGSTFSRDSVVATAGEDSYILHDMSRNEIEVTLDGNTAIVSTRWKGKGIYRGKYFDEDQRCSLTIVKKDGKVEILSEHCTPINIARVFH